MTAEFTVRPARPADAGRVAEFNLALALESENLKLDPATVRNGVRRGLADPAKGFYLVAESADAVVGQLMVTFEWSDWRDGVFWWVQSVYVAPQARRRGVFRALFAATESKAKSTPDVVAVRLYVEGHNEAALATYASLGFRDAGYRVLERPLAP